MHQRRVAAASCAALLVLAVGARADTAAEPEARALAERLAASLRIPTVSPQDPADFRAEPFEELLAHLEATYPRTYAALDRRRINTYSRLLEWRGSDPDLAPALFMSHLDVVPIEPGTEAEWTHPPFAGTVGDFFVWGRGAIDVKSGVVALHEAVERLLGTGFEPRRSLFFAFGHDEEVGGDAGAAAIAAHLRERGVHFEFAVDEGGFILEGFPELPDRPVASINVAEKTYFTVHLAARGEGGHSSMPPRHSAVGKLAAALHRLESSPMPPRLTEPVRLYLERIAPELSGGRKFALGNLWLTQPLVLREMAADRVTNAMVRTTTAVTMFHGGVKENVVPQEAHAVVNFRILPSETPEDVLEHVRATIDDPEIVIEADTWASAPKPGRVDTRAWKLLEQSIADVHPDALVVPGLLTGATDTRHFSDLADDVYRFFGFRVPIEDVRGAHGTNERIGIASFSEGVRITAAVLRRAGE